MFRSGFGGLLLAWVRRLVSGETKPVPSTFRRTCPCGHVDTYTTRLRDQSGGWSVRASRPRRCCLASGNPPCFTTITHPTSTCLCTHARTPPTYTQPRATLSSFPDAMSQYYRRLHKGGDLGSNRHRAAAASGMNGKRGRRTGWVGWAGQ